MSDRLEKLRTSTAKTHKNQISIPSLGWAGDVDMLRCLAQRSAASGKLAEETDGLLGSEGGLDCMWQLSDVLNPEVDGLVAGLFPVLLRALQRLEETRKRGSESGAAHSICLSGGEVDGVQLQRCTLTLAGDADKPPIIKVMPKPMSGCTCLEISASGVASVTLGPTPKPYEPIFYGYTPKPQTTPLDLVRLMIGTLAAWARDPNIMQRAGRAVGRCMYCDKDLTDDGSKQRGVGPDCYKRYGPHMFAGYMLPEGGIVHVDGIGAQPIEEWRETSIDRAFPQLVWERSPLLSGLGEEGLLSASICTAQLPEAVAVLASELTARLGDAAWEDVMGALDQGLRTGWKFAVPAGLLRAVVLVADYLGVENAQLNVLLHRARAVASADVLPLIMDRLAMTEAAAAEPPPKKHKKHKMEPQPQPQKHKKHKKSLADDEIPLNQYAKILKERKRAEAQVAAEYRRMQAVAAEYRRINAEVAHIFKRPKDL